MKNRAEIKSRLAQLGKDLGKDTELILFGSQTRGSATSDSDWYVLVLLPEEGSQEISGDRQEIRRTIFPIGTGRK